MFAETADAQYPSLIGCYMSLQYMSQNIQFLSSRLPCYCGIFHVFKENILGACAQGLMESRAFTSTILQSLEQDLKKGAFNFSKQQTSGFLEILSSGAIDGQIAGSAAELEEILLFEAAASNWVEMMAHLLGAEVNPDSSPQGITPLLYAAHQGLVDVIRALVKAGVDLNKGCPEGLDCPPNFDALAGFTPLMVAVNQGHLEAAQLLLSAGADFDQPNSFGMASIHRAARFGHTEIAQSLAQAGADLNRATDEGWTPLGTAAVNGHVGVLRVLEGAGVDINSTAPRTPTAPENESNPGSPALVHAADYGHLEAVRFLLDSGADVGMVDMENGNAALYKAAGEGHLGVVQLLVGSGADLERRGMGGETALFTAAQRDRLAVVRYLVEEGAEVDHCNGVGETPLIAACHLGFLDIIKCLVEAGANPSAVSSTKGTSPLWNAATAGHLEAVEYLLRKGARDGDFSVSPLPLRTLMVFHM